MFIYKYDSIYFCLKVLIILIIHKNLNYFYSTYADGDNKCIGGVLRNYTCLCNSGFELIERYNGRSFVKDKCQSLY